MSTRGGAVPLYVPGKRGSGASLTVRPTIPSSNDNAAAGFSNGSQLYSTAARSTYLCVDAASGLWVRTNRHERRNIVHMSPAIANTMEQQPAIFPLVGAVTTPAQTPGGTLRTQVYRTNFQTAGVEAGTRTGNQWFRPSVSGQGGVRLCEFWVAPAPAAGPVLAGMWLGLFSAANIPIGTDPDTLANVFGFGKRGGFAVNDTEIHFVTSDATGTPTWTTCGADFPANDPELCMLATLYWSDEDDGHAYAQLERQDAPGLFVADVTLNLPALDTLLLWISVCSTFGAPVDFDLAYAEIESL